MLLRTLLSVVPILACLYPFQTSTQRQPHARFVGRESDLVHRMLPLGNWTSLMQPLWNVVLAAIFLFMSTVQLKQIYQGKQMCLLFKRGGGLDFVCGGPLCLLCSLCRCQLIFCSVLWRPHTQFLATSVFLPLQTQIYCDFPTYFSFPWAAARQR